MTGQDSGPAVCGCAVLRPDRAPRSDFVQRKPWTIQLPDPVEQPCALSASMKAWPPDHLTPPRHSREEGAPQHYEEHHDSEHAHHQSPITG